VDALKRVRVDGVTIEDALAAVAGSVRENIRLRRAFRWLPLPHHPVTLVSIAPEMCKSMPSLPMIDRSCLDSLKKLLHTQSCCAE
jgi:hypothetical protein